MNQKGYLGMEIMIRTPKGTSFYIVWWSIEVKDHYKIIIGSDVEITFLREFTTMPLISPEDSVSQFNSRIAFNFPDLDGSAYWKNPAQWFLGTMSSKLQTFSLGSLLLDGGLAHQVKISLFSNFIWGKGSNGVQMKKQIDIGAALTSLNIVQTPTGPPRKLKLAEMRVFEDQSTSFQLSWDLPFPDNILTSYPPKYSDFQLNCKVFGMYLFESDKYPRSCVRCFNSKTKADCVKCWNKKTFSRSHDWYTETTVDYMGQEHRVTKLSDQNVITRSHHEFVADFRFTYQSIPFLATIDLLANDWQWGFAANNHFQKLWKGSGLKHHPKYLENGLQQLGIPVYKFNYFVPLDVNFILNKMPPNTLWLPGEHHSRLEGLKREEVNDIGLICRVRVVKRTTEDYHGGRNNTFVHESKYAYDVKQTFGEWSEPLAFSTQKPKASIQFFATTYQMERHKNASGVEYFSNIQHLFHLRYDFVAEKFVKAQDFPITNGEWNQVKEIFSYDYEYLERQSLIPLRPLIDVSGSNKEDGKVRVQDYYTADLMFYPFKPPEERTSNWTKNISAEELTKKFHGRSFAYTREEIASRDRVGCFHFGFKEWFIFKPTIPLNRSSLIGILGWPLNSERYSSIRFHLVRQHTHVNMWENWAYFENMKWTKSSYKTSNVPHSIKCPQLGNTVIWSEVEKNHAAGKPKIHIFRIILHNIVGSVVRGPERLDETKLCACSPAKALDLGNIDVIYPELNNPYHADLLVSCGQVVCAVNISGSDIGPSRKVMDFKTLTALEEKVRFFQFDQEHIYYMKEQNPAVFITPRTDVAKPLVLDKIPASKFWYNFEMKPFPKDTEHVQNFYNWIYVYKDETKLPVPPRMCLKYLDIENIKVSMISNKTMKIEIGNLWDIPDGCQSFSLPNKTFEIRYGKLNSNQTDENSTAEHLSCEEMKGTQFEYNQTSLVRCSKAHSLNESAPTLEVQLSNLDPSSWYLIAISVYPQLPSKLIKLWLSGRHDVAPKKLVFFTGFSKTAELLTGSTYNVWLILTNVFVLLICGIICFLLWLFFLRTSWIRLSSSDVTIGKLIATGSYGDICHAIWHSFGGRRRVPVVVKTLTDSASEKQRRQFLEESILLSKIGSPHIVQTIGVCLHSNPQMLVLELVSKGPLDKYLQNTEIQHQLRSCDLLSFVKDSLNACIYLESHGIIHRNIAASNCLVSEAPCLYGSPYQKLKLAGFGKAKDGGRLGQISSFDDVEALSIQWTAPESLGEARKSSSKSDVWSLGVLAYEIFSWASVVPFGQCQIQAELHEIPCSQVPINPESLRKKISGSEKYNLLKRPDPCVSNFTEPLKTKIFRSCWQFDPMNRPSFKELSKVLKKIQKSLTSMTLKVVPGAQDIGFQQSQPDARNGTVAEHDTSIIQMDPVSICPDFGDIELGEHGNRNGHA